MTKLVRAVALLVAIFVATMCGLHEGRQFARSRPAQAVICSYLVDTRLSWSRRASATPGGAVPHHPRESCGTHRERQQR